MEKISVLAPAKINLYLNVGARRADGYHEIETVMQTVSLFDRLEVTKNPISEKNEILLFCRDAKIPSDENNLVYRAALAFFEEAKIEEYNVEFLLEKRIPSEAGLGGGSSDAAATILALDRLYHTAMSLDTMCKIGVRLGADIPFCIKKGTVYATGIGEIMESAPPMPDCAFVIAVPKGKGISTGAAYKALDTLPADENAVSFADFKKAVSACNLEAMSEMLYNKFEAVTPEETGSAQLREMLLATGAMGARMSGSGSSVFAVYPHIGAARKAKVQLEDSADVFVCEPARRDYPYIEA
ncbi:MAG: 4-(cytidine 5'-diphospho)-2-C-methyl-D-erythritol kinase [Clostridia bacterium]|nr:4-(cytidine 5'-diphospho)-2-C-methyl-D-erythritol kinase [Clostridia bacterium]